MLYYYYAFLYSVQKQNALNYWIPSTLKKFPLLLNCLLDQLIDTSQSSGFENSVFSVISLLKLGQKGGLLFNKWDENFSISSFKYLDFLNFMRSAMRHSSEAVRSKAFTVVCMSCKSCIIPSLEEFEMVQIFLVENVNTDSASLREEILKSFALFLTRICDSSVHAIEVEQGAHNSKQNEEMGVSWISQSIQFLNWIHNFLISNLEPGTNYQRRVLSLQLYMLILSYFTELPDLTKTGTALRKKGTAVEGKKVMEYALTLGQWPFVSEGSQKAILSCVLDSSDDIREAAGLILMKYFSFDKSDAEGHKPLLDYALQLCTSTMFYENESGALLMKVLGNWAYKMPEKKRNELLCSLTRTKCDKNVTRNRHHSSILMPCNQQKLLADLENKPTRTVHNKVGSSDCTEVELEKKVKMVEGTLVTNPSLLQDMCNTELSEETKIFEGMTVIAKDRSVGQCTASPVVGKSCSLCSKQTYLVADSFSNTVNQDNVKSQSCNKTSEELSKGKQGEVTLSSKLHKREGFIVIDSTQDIQCNSPAFSRPRDSEEFTVLNPHSVCSPASSSDHESPKFQQPLCFKSSVITDAESIKHDDRINSNQKSKELRVPVFGFTHCHIVEETWEHTGQIVKPDDWHLSEYSKSKSYCKYESDIGKNGCWHPSRSDCQSESNIGTSGCLHLPKNTKQLEPENVTQTYSGSAPLSFILLTQAEAQLTSLQGDFFQAASSGSPLHGTLTALIRLATQSDSPECGLMSAEEVNRTVTLLEQTVSFLLHLLAAKSLSTSGTLLFTFGLTNHLFIC